MLPKNRRIGTVLLKKVIKEGIRVESPLFSMKVLSGEKSLRFAVVVPKKVSLKAVVRNVLKRRVSHVLRDLSSRLTPSSHVVLTLKRGVEVLSFSTLTHELETLFKKARLLS